MGVHLNRSPRPLVGTTTKRPILPHGVGSLVEPGKQISLVCLAQMSMGVHLTYIQDPQPHQHLGITKGALAVLLHNCAIQIAIHLLTYLLTYTICKCTSEKLVSKHAQLHTNIQPNLGYEPKSVHSRKSHTVSAYLNCAYLVWPYLEVNAHDKDHGLADQSMKKPILVDLILFSLFLKQFTLGASTVSRSKLFHMSMTQRSHMTGIYYTTTTDYYLG